MTNAVAKMLFVALFAAFLSTFVLLTIIPAYPYHPNCGGLRKPIYLRGPLRPEYQAHLESAMKDEGVDYWKINGRIYVPYLPVFDVNEFFNGGHDFYVNFEWRFLQSLALGYAHDGTRIEPPKALMDAVRASEDEYGPFPPKILNDISGRFSDCAVMRAGAIRVEALDK